MINGRLQRRFTVATTYSATAVALHGEPRGAIFSMAWGWNL